MDENGTLNKKGSWRMENESLRQEEKNENGERGDEKGKEYSK
jgi:hypothetical protein